MHGVCVFDTLACLQEGAIIERLTQVNKRGCGEGDLYGLHLGHGSHDDHHIQYYFLGLAELAEESPRQKVEHRWEDASEGGPSGIY